MAAARRGRGRVQADAAKEVDQPRLNLHSTQAAARGSPPRQRTTSTGACTTVSATTRLPLPCRPASYTLTALGGTTAELGASCCWLVKAAAPLLVLAPARLPRPPVLLLPAPPLPEPAEW